MRRILEGVLEFQRADFPQEREYFEQLASGQRPEALLITCADSRIEPAKITKTRPGDLFIVRNIGNLVPIYGDSEPSVSAAVEYALEVLHVQHVIVCGHSHCGAMDALLRPQILRDLPAVAEWLSKAGDLRRQDVTLEHLTEQNVLTQIGHLRTYPAVSRMARRGELVLHGWVYDIPTGGVRAWDAEAGKFMPLQSALQKTTAEVGR
jgi:carbonic anhydrase